MVAEILGVVKLTPVPNAVPPVLTSYQLSVPTLATAPKLTVPVPQRLFGVLEVMLGAPTTAITAVRGEETHAALLAST